MPAGYSMVKIYNKHANSDQGYTYSWRWYTTSNHILILLFLPLYNIKGYIILYLYFICHVLLSLTFFKNKSYMLGKFLASSWNDQIHLASFSLHAAESNNWVCVPVTMIFITNLFTISAATRAVEVGAAGIIVSNHGARQLDYSPSTISVLEEVILFQPLLFYLCKPQIW